MKAEDVAKWLEGITIDPGGGFMRRAAVIRELIEERDALRTLLATARAHMLGDGHSYDSEVITAINAALVPKP